MYHGDNHGDNGPNKVIIHHCQYWVGPCRTILVLHGCHQCSALLTSYQSASIVFMSALAFVSMSCYMHTLVVKSSPICPTQAGPPHLIFVVQASIHNLFTILPNLDELPSSWTSKRSCTPLFSCSSSLSFGHAIVPTISTGIMS
jgi:hypothetical protein